MPIGDRLPECRRAFPVVRSDDRREPTACFAWWARTRRDGNATTAQFIARAERVSGRDLGALFTAWLYPTSKPAHP
jgi:hypothetical protein